MELLKEILHVVVSCSGIYFGIFAIAISVLSGTSYLVIKKISKKGR